MGRAPCCDKANVKRGPWTPEEDATLKNYLRQHGSGGNWIALPRKAGLKRCGKSCRLRWLNYLRPDIRHGGFTEEEDNIIYTLYSSMGSRWSIIASRLPGRTDNDVKNYWNTKLKKKLLLEGKIGAKNVNNDNNSTANNTTDPNLAQISVSISNVQSQTYSPGSSPWLDGNSSALTPTMEVGYRQYCEIQGIILDKNQIFPVSGPMEVPNLVTTGCNSFSVSSSSSSKEVLSCLSSASASPPLGSNHGSSTGTVTQDDGFLQGFELAYELLNEFGNFQEQYCSEFAP